MNPQDTRPRINPKAAIFGSLLIGGIAGAAILGPLAASAASPSPSAASSSSAPSVSSDNDAAGPGSGHTEAVTDTSVVAKAIGISEADLLTALHGGQTVAQVAKAHSVDVQKVIDALVADGLSELAARVQSGAITHAQADAQKAAVTQRATDQVNGSLMGGRH